MKLDFLKRKKWVRLELSNQDAREAAALREAAGLRQGQSRDAAGPTPAVRPEVTSGNIKSVQSEPVASKSPGPEEVLCPGCGAIHSKQDWALHHKVCHLCGKHGRISSVERAAQLLDPGSFEALAMERYSSWSPTS